MKAVRLVSAAVSASAVLLAASRPGLAHKPITSPYTFNEDVQPILREHCVSCHVDGGVAPMPLMTHAETVPWAESMRVELVAGHMPPWGIEGDASRFVNTKPLTARELNVLLTWAAGGTPPGAPGAPPPQPGAGKHAWPLGEPDVILQPAREFVMPADVQDHVEEFTLEYRGTGTRWLRAVDVRPGDPTVVRSATVSLAPGTSAGASPLEVPLALWVPGDAPVPTAEATGFMLPPDARLTLRVHYKKTWQRERDVVRDLSTVGLYFAAGMATSIQAATMDAVDSGPAPREPSTGATRPSPETRRPVETWPWQSWEQLPSGADAIAFSRTLGASVRAYAIYADLDLHGVSISVEAVRADGVRDTLITFRPQAGWMRRYWFREPKELPRGTRIEVHATRDAVALLPPGAIHRDAMDLNRVRVALDVARVN